MLDVTFFRKVGPNVRDKFRKHIFQDAKDVYGKPFKAYTSKYGQRKRANKFKRQASQYANSKAPILTSDLLKDYSLIKTSPKGFQIGFPTRGSIVKGLEKMGRVITTMSKPLPDGVTRFLDNSAEKYIKSKVKRNLKGGTFKI